MLLTLTKDAAANLRLPHRAGDFAFTPHCGKEVPDELAKAMLKDGKHLYAIQSPDTMKAAEEGAKLNTHIDAEAEKKLKAEESDKKRFAEEFERGKAAGLGELVASEAFQAEVAKQTAEKDQIVADLKDQIAELKKKLKEALK